ncbi:MAG: 50S ribosomal protein L18 [Candidatus Staskawiczbacteria bacterium RIFOXYD1_FULL_39_28]|uniref:Large ribosomal subunit protein uL18 n=1 Tax=Candidatus Staskawiczbacteria bacterium RIFOXYC1_FULL_38_18 TaxID=1802229 RepID=A0A1G2JCX8_9BACT|nr:MAG: 50S ribosomal protein L18 [Candidatus Staskawiczbacteria bacterium RIFOXYC1_FULL_38_18]OGZ90272.1 MAG: 50S ribosomal protein L18 [Candidatus Staskawiczbacteria bacterium RIFOXYD1_FULL_39_28]
MSVKQEKRIRRHKKIRKSIFGTKDRPRLCVFRSNQHIYAQLIVDSEKPKVLMSVSDVNIKPKKGEKKSDVAKEIGKLIAKKAIEAKIESVVFDRAGIIFHGRIKALAEGAREGGLKF